MLTNSKNIGDLNNTYKNKGFTLIELLAVIVILAIIALIATPIILKVIEDAKKSAAVDSAYGYIEAIEFNNAMAQVNKKYTDKEIITDEKLESVNSKINVKGEKATEISSLIVTKGKVTYMNMCINGYIIEYKDGQAKTLDKCNNKKGPSLTLGNPTILPNSITIPYTASSDSETEEETISVTCKYGTSMGNYTEEGTVSDNKCTLSNLTSTSKYYYQITATNEAGKSTILIGNATTIKSEIAEIAKALVYDGDTCKTDGTTYTFMDGCYLKGKPTNNYVSYGGYVWRIMGINSDGSVRLITNTIVTSMAYKEYSKASEYTSSTVASWLNNDFYTLLNDTEGIIQEGAYYCSQSTTSKTASRTTCENIITTKIGMMSLDEYNLASATLSYLSIGKNLWTITPYSDTLVWRIKTDGTLIATLTLNSHGVSPIINIKTNKTIAEGNGTSGSPYKLS